MNDSVKIIPGGEYGFSQEALKAIACGAMLVDHIGSVLIPLPYFRFVGRIAFPIFCFLLAEGVHHTKNPGKYFLRLLLGMLLSEVPFDLAFFGGWTWAHQSVMVTLVLGFLALEAMAKVEELPAKFFLAQPFALLANLLHTDYGAFGVELIALYGITRGMHGERWIQLVGMLLLLALHPSSHAVLFGIRIPVKITTPLAMALIALYSGAKGRGGKGMQWFFYLFYPAHILLLWIISRWI